MRFPRPELLASVLASAIVLLNLDAPLVEDGLFWWVPKAMLAAERGPLWVMNHLPEAARPMAELPPQWQAGLPDYGHPPLWFWYMGLWIKLLGPHPLAVHIGALPLAALMGWGLVALGRAAGGEHGARAAIVLPLLPPVAANLLRADTDLPLMALTPWALWAILNRREGLFALTAALATGCKEPAVLLAGPALLANLIDRRPGYGWLWPPMVLAAWAGLHHAETGWYLAGSERLPETFGGWLHDLGSVTRIVALSQGRWIALPLAAWGLTRRPVDRAVLILGAHTLIQILFFGTLNFLGGIDRIDAHTHVRYLIPAMLGGGSLALALSPVAAIPVGILSFMHLHSASADGPEASLYGLDVARAARLAAPRVAALSRPVWVGSYMWTQYTRPYAGVVEVPIDGLSLYAYGTDPATVSGWVVESCEGEPLGRLQELPLELEETLWVQEAWVRLYRVGLR